MHNAWRKLEPRSESAAPCKSYPLKNVSNPKKDDLKQGASASHMTAAKVLDVISRLPGCSAQTSDAATACAQVEWHVTPELLNMMDNMVLTHG